MKKTIEQIEYEVDLVIQKVCNDYDLTREELLGDSLPFDLKKARQDYEFGHIELDDIEIMLKGWAEGVLEDMQNGKGEEVLVRIEKFSVLLHRIYDDKEFYIVVENQKGVKEILSKFYDGELYHYIIDLNEWNKSTMSINLLLNSEIRNK